MKYNVHVEIIERILWQELLGYVHEGHVNGFEKAVKQVAEKIVDKKESPYSPEYVAKLKEALEDIANIGISQSPARNMDSADWYFKLFNKCQRIAKEVLGNDAHK